MRQRGGGEPRVDGVGRDTTVDQKYRVKVSGTPDSSTWQWRRTRTYYNAANQADSTVLFDRPTASRPARSGRPARGRCRVTPRRPTAWAPV